MPASEKRARPGASESKKMLYGPFMASPKKIPDSTGTESPWKLYALDFSITLSNRKRV
jgi:hypothetical protein